MGSITRLSHRFRDASLGAPDLWTIVDVALLFPGLVEILKLYLEHSRSREIWVTVRELSKGKPSPTVTYGPTSVILNHISIGFGDYGLNARARSRWKLRWNHSDPSQLQSWRAATPSYTWSTVPRISRCLRGQRVSLKVRRCKNGLKDPEGSFTVAISKQCLALVHLNLETLGPHEQCEHAIPQISHVVFVADNATSSPIRQGSTSNIIVQTSSL
ncbi:hypothetical protein DFH07DRAFT_573646 [Mycena maculata]|uniref:Uncharacterized protein n=1 Tax=Mycena maculata TaxID=230809 RepID=A0AAD7IPQ9_9AGAR|nr:hypothetical protein DFH07DRAFT_573646 [Mycena maculata]